MLVNLNEKNQHVLLKEELLSLSLHTWVRPSGLDLDFKMSGSIFVICQQSKLCYEYESFMLHNKNTYFYKKERYKYINISW